MQPPPATTSSAPRLAALLVAAALAAALADSVYQVPIQVSDSLEEIIAADAAPSASVLFTGGFAPSSSTLRPLRRVQARWLLDVARATGLSHHAVFRGAHAVMTVLLIGLFLALLPVRTWIDAAAMAVSLTILMGHHTFAGMLREAYPVNHYEVVACCCLAFVVLARRSPSALTDALALVLLAGSLLLIESGVLVWIAIAAAWGAGLPGARRRTLILSTGVIGLYVIVRLALDIGAPGIGGHASGWIDRVYEADALERMFAARPWLFMAYNVAGAVATVLFSEPRRGVFTTLAAWGTGDLRPVVVIQMASSVLATSVIAWHAVGRIRNRRTAWDESDRLLVVCLVIILANGVLAASYIKDEIVSAAGVFYAAAAFLSLRSLLTRAPAWGNVATPVVALALVAGAGLWAFRALGVHYELRAAASTTRSDWVEILVPDPAVAGPLTGVADRIGREVVARRGTSTRFLPDWGDRYWVQ